jgi:tRNA-2-methylthio-N6-dimethylallyladenosine synthase
VNDSKKVFVKTFGCQMNVYDSERMLRLAESAGYLRAEDAESADLIIVNTCSVRDKPEHKAVSEIGWMHKRARAHEGVKLVLAGCVAQQLADSLLKSHPFIDLVLGTAAIGRLPGLLSRIESGERVVDCADSDADIGMPLADETTPGRSGPSAFVSIMRGCNNYCSYCIVPYVRGPEKSRAPGEILDEVRQFVDEGAREVTLLGQNVNSYGRGLEEAIDFTELLGRVHEIQGIERIRFTTSHPKDLSDRLVQAFADLPKLAGHMHLPVQSGADTVLKRMARIYTIDQYCEKAEKLRMAKPHMAISTDLIVGFCGETDREFQETMDLLDRIRYDSAFSFKYSPRPGTAAAKFDDDVPDAVKKERLAILQKRQEQITLERNLEQLGRTVSVLVEGPGRGGPDRRKGRSECHRIVHFNDGSANPGDLVAIRIDEAFQNALVGTPVKPLK